MQKSRRLVPRDRRARGGELPAEPMDAETALHPLHERLHSQAEGHPPHHGRLFDGVSSTIVTSSTAPEEDVYWCAADVDGSPGTPTSSTGRFATGHLRDVRGSSRLSHKGSGGADRALRRDDLLHRATAIRTCIKWGAKLPQGFDLSSLRLLGPSGSRSTRRRGCGTQGDGASAARSSTRGADRDRGDHDHAAAGHHLDQAGLATTPFPGSRRGVTEATARRSRRAGLLVIKRPWPDAADPVPRRRAVRRDLFLALRQEHLPRR